MLKTIKEDWRGVLFQSLVTALAFVLMLWGLATALGNREADVLEDVRDAARAQVCVLALPVTEHGRRIPAVNECLRANGLPPLGPRGSP